jgi:hypothetical protein
MDYDRRDARRALALASAFVVLWWVAESLLLSSVFNPNRYWRAPVPPLERVCLFVDIHMGLPGFIVAGLIPHIPFWVYLAVGGAVNLAVYGVSIYLLLRLWSFLRETLDALQKK